MSFHPRAFGGFTYGSPRPSATASPPFRNTTCYIRIRQVDCIYLRRMASKTSPPRKRRMYTFVFNRLIPPPAHTIHQPMASPENTKRARSGRARTAASDRLAATTPEPTSISPRALCPPCRGWPCCCWLTPLPPLRWIGRDLVSRRPRPLT